MTDHKDHFAVHEKCLLSFVLLFHVLVVAKVRLLKINIEETMLYYIRTYKRIF